MISTDPIGTADRILDDARAALAAAIAALGPGRDS